MCEPNQRDDYLSVDCVILLSDFIRPIVYYRRCMGIYKDVYIPQPAKNNKKYTRFCMNFHSYNRRVTCCCWHPPSSIVLLACSSASLAYIDAYTKVGQEIVLISIDCSGWYISTIPTVVARKFPVLFFCLTFNELVAYSSSLCWYWEKSAIIMDAWSPPTPAHCQD